jgi:hypothetical protein
MRFVALLALFPAVVVAAPTLKIVGSWQSTSPKAHVTMVFGRNGDYNSTVEAKSKVVFSGRYELTSGKLRLNITTATSWRGGLKKVTKLDRTGDAKLTWKDDSHIVIGVEGGPSNTFPRIKTGR